MAYNKKLALCLPGVLFGPSLHVIQVLRDARWVLPTEVLQGLTFAALWAADTDYVHDIAPRTYSRKYVLPFEARACRAQAWTKYQYLFVVMVH